MLCFLPGSEPDLVHEEYSAKGSRSTMAISTTGFRGPPLPAMFPRMTTHLTANPTLVASLSDSPIQRHKLPRGSRPDLVHEKVQGGGIAQYHGHVSHRLQGIPPTPHASPRGHALSIPSPH